VTNPNIKDKYSKGSGFINNCCH